MNEKLREEQWKRDQEGKALERQVRKLKDDTERAGMERVQETDKLREEMADRLRDQVEAQKKELQRQDQMWKDRVQQNTNEIERLRFQLQEARGQIDDEAAAREKYRRQADDLEGMLHKGKEVERKELVQL